MLLQGVNDARYSMTVDNGLGSFPSVSSLGGASTLSVGTAFGSSQQLLTTTSTHAHGQSLIEGLKTLSSPPSRRTATKASSRRSSLPKRTGAVIDMTASYARNCRNKVAFCCHSVHNINGKRERGSPQSRVRLLDGGRDLMFVCIASHS